MKLFISKIAFALSMIAIFSCVSVAQKEDYVWHLGDSCLNFSYNPAKVDFCGNTEGSRRSLSCISDRDGNLLFCRVGFNLYNYSGQLVDRSYSSILQSPSLLPFPGNPDKTLFFYDVRDTAGLICSVIDNFTAKKSILKIFDQRIVNYIFVQQGYSDNIWMIANYWPLL